MDEAWTQGVVDSAGVAIHFHRTGDGEQPSLVLAHGFSDNGLCFRRTARALEDVFDIVMVDARNHGMSARARGDVTMQAEDVAAVISDLGLDRPAVMGHSMGASTMAVLAAGHPGMVSRLVLEDPPWRDQPGGGGELSEDERVELRSYVESFADMTDVEILELGRTQGSGWPDSEFPDWVEAKQQLSEMAADNLTAPDWSETVKHVGCPTLLIRGDLDRGGIVSSATAQRAEQLTQQLSTRYIPNAGHNVRRENFDDFIAAVRSFLLS